jgi:hypothetical protein
MIPRGGFVVLFHGCCLGLGVRNTKKIGCVSTAVGLSCMLHEVFVLKSNSIMRLATATVETSSDYC